MKVTDLALRKPVVIACDATVSATAELMAASGVGAVIVVDGETPVGIVTDRDIVTRGVAHQYPTDGRIDGLMSMGLVALDADDDLDDILHVFSHHAVRRIPIVAHDRVVGVISIDDLLVSMSSELTDLSRVLAAQIMFPHAGDEAHPPSPV
ncbi:MAG: CBS domain-containing protein [Actinobacteria bacterium]|jgi:CBS domain-containing protein|nr:CBS domain-containing protein [Actinomycetota bacterium]